MSMKIIKTVLAVLALTMFSAIFTSGVRADGWDKKTVLTFSQPVEIPGQILPAGTYTFTITNSASDRHVVQIFNADGSQIIATVLAVNNWRLQPTGDTVIKFSERSGDNPEAVKAWFYPGDNFGQEFVYPRARAMELAVVTKEPIPALDDTTPANMITTPIVAITPEQKEVPVAEVIAVTQPVVQEPAPAVAQQPATVVAQDTTPLVAENTTLPKTASMVPLIALLGLASLGFAFVIKRFAIRES
jgi:hypothetical protein